MGITNAVVGILKCLDGLVQISVDAAVADASEG